MRTVFLAVRIFFYMTAAKAGQTIAVLIIRQGGDIMKGGSGYSGKNRKYRLALTVGLMILLTFLVSLGVILSYWNNMLNQMGDASAEDGITQPKPVETAVITEQTEPAAVMKAVQETLREEQQIINIMLIGQNQNLADTMILCSVNRDTNTVTLISFLRDLYLPIPAYAGHNADRNRINTCYYWGRKWKGCPEGGMELLAACVEQNFGISVDHSVAVDFNMFVKTVDLLGGVEIDLTEKEAGYLSRNVGYVGDFKPGLQTLNGTEALAYSRIRKIDSDIHRTQRQRNLISSILSKCRGLRLKQLHSLAAEIMPMITTDMSKQEITEYILEFLPLLNKLEIKNATCPADNKILPGSRWDKKVEIGGLECDVIVCDIVKNREYLLSFLGAEKRE